MALGILALTYLIVIAASVFGVLAMFLPKNEKAKKIVCFAMAIWGMVIAAANAFSYPSNWIMPQALSLGFGFVAIVGLVVRILSKNKKQIMFAKLLTIASVAGGVFVLMVI